MVPILGFFINLTQFLYVFTIFLTKNVVRKSNQCPSPLQEKMLGKTYESCAALNPMLNTISERGIDKYKCDVNVKVDNNGNTSKKTQSYFVNKLSVL